MEEESYRPWGWAFKIQKSRKLAIQLWVKDRKP